MTDDQKNEVVDLLVDVFSNTMYFEKQSVLAFLNIFGRKSVKVLEFNIDERNLEKLRELNPLRLTSEQLLQILPVAYVTAIKEVACEERAEFLHHFIWPIWTINSSKSLSSFDEQQRRALWLTFKNVQENITGLSDDPYWEANSARIRDFFLGE